MSFRTRMSVLMLLSILPFSASAGWRELHPLFGGRIDVIAVDAGGTVYSAGPGGLFKSIDGGASWSIALGDLPTTAVVVITPDPVQVGTVYVGTDQGIFRTTNGGANWTRLPLNLPGGVTIQNVVVAPTDTNRIFVSTWGSSVWRSLDRGATWQQRASGLYGGPGGSTFIPAIAVDPTNANRVYTSTWRGRLFRSDDAATTWYQIADSGTWANGEIHVSRSSPNILYMTHDEYWFGRGTVLKSTDYGSSWTNAGRPAPFYWTGTNIGQLAIHPTDPNTVYVTSASGIYRTTVGGGLWSFNYVPPTGQGSMTPIAFDPSNPSYVFAGSYYTGFYRTTNAGASWTQNNAGIASASFVGIDVCRDVPSVLFTGAQGAGYWKSSDGGFTWSAIGTAQGMQNHSLGGLAVHPQNPNIVITNTGDATTTRIWKSVDGGASFTPAATSYGSSWFRFNPLAPTHISASISDWQGGFLHSSDTGSSWYVPHWWYIYPGNYDFHPTYPNVVLGVASQYTGAALSTLHVLWSNNYGVSWTSLPGVGKGWWNEVALDKNDPTTLYAAGQNGYEGTQGVYKFNVAYSGANVIGVTRIPGTFNNGLSNTSVRRLLYDKTNGYLYASTPSGVFRSSDKALTWTSINDGLPYLSTDWLAATPDGQRIFVTTSGGVWEYADSLPVPVATPVVNTTPSDLLQYAVFGSTKTMSVRGETTTAADTITLTSTPQPLPTNMTFTATSGNPATGTLLFTPGGNQLGQTYPVSFTAESTLDATKSATVDRYISVIGDPATDAAALISAGSAGSVNTPDGQFSMDLAAGSIPGAELATVNVVYKSNYRRADVYVDPGTGRGRVTVLTAYDITVNGLDHYVFESPVALTFAYPAGTDPSTLLVVVYDEVDGAFEPRTDTSCLAAFGRLPLTGTIATGGTISVCTTTVSLWAVADMSTFVANDPPVANAGVDQTHEAIAGGNSVVLDGSASSDPDGDPLTFTWTGSFGTAAGMQPSIVLGVGVHEITLTVDDGRGGTATDTVVITIQDTTPPVIVISSPPDGVAYLLNESAIASFTCSDDVSGIDVCAGTIANGASLDTASVGAKSITVTATDGAGNTSTLTHAYFVRYAFTGFLPPVSAGVNGIRAGRVVPLKWKIADVHGVWITDVASVQSIVSAPFACDGVPAPITGPAALPAGGSVLRYDILAEQFVFDWQTDKTWTGCRLLQMTLADGAHHWAMFEMK